MTKIVDSVRNLKEPFKPSARRGGLAAVLLIASIWYAIAHRPLADVLLYSYIATIPFAYGFVFRELKMYLGAAKTPIQKVIFFAKILLPAPIVAILIIPVGCAYYGIVSAVLDVLRWVAIHLSDSGRSASLAIAISAFLGVAFFVFRLKFRFVYGMTEAFVGLAVAGYRATSTGTVDTALLLTVLTAGVYLVVRGLDNMHQAWTTKSDAILNWFLSESPKSSNE